MTQCSFCNTEIPEAIVIRDLNNNNYCRACAEKKLKEYKPFSKYVRKKYVK